MADDDKEEPTNPFAGTPMEHLMGAFGNGDFDMTQILGQVQRMLAPHDGTVNFDLAKEVARHTLAAAGPDPSPHAGHVGAVNDAARLAEMWLDSATSLPAGAQTAAAWSKAEWIEATAETWHTLVEPIAAHVVQAMTDAMPAEAKAFAGPLLGMLTQASGAMFGQQIGQALGALAGEVLSSTDIGLPLTTDKVAAVIPSTIGDFGDGLEHSKADVMLYVMLRECAHQRLFAHATWLRPALLGAIEEFGRGTRIDTASIEAQLREIDPSRPEDLQDALTGGLFEPERTPEQQRALTRLETLLAYVEGWVADVVATATADRMPSAPALAEAMRRRRATGGPAERTFAALVGLEMRPRRLREATTVWAAMRDGHGIDARDAAWSHPDLMPTTQDLDDPLAFAQRGPRASSDQDFDTALGAWLAQDDSDES
jgi:putative hydrolase